MASFSLVAGARVSSAGAFTRAVADGDRGGRELERRRDVGFGDEDALPQ